MVVFPHHHNRAVGVGYHGSGNGPHDHAGESPEAAGAHDDHFVGFAELQQHVDGGAFGNGVGDFEVRVDFFSDFFGFFDNAHGFGLQFVEEFLGWHHSFCVEELWHGVAGGYAERNATL